MMFMNLAAKQAKSLDPDKIKDALDHLRQFPEDRQPVDHVADGLGLRTPTPVTGHLSKPGPGAFVISPIGPLTDGQITVNVNDLYPKLNNSRVGIGEVVTGGVQARLRSEPHGNCREERWVEGGDSAAIVTTVGMCGPRGLGIARLARDHDDLCGLGPRFIYAMVAVGFNIVFIATGTVNFAQAQYAMLGTLLAYITLVHLHLNLIFAIPLGFALGALLGFTEERVAIRYLPKQSVHGELVTTVGFSVLVEGLAIASSDESLCRGYRVSSPRTQPSRLPRRFIYPYQIVMIAVSVAIVLVALRLVARKTLVGLSSLATSEDKTAAILRGINVRQLQVGAYMLAGGLLVAVGPFIATTTVCHLHDWRHPEHPGLRRDVDRGFRKSQGRPDRRALVGASTGVRGPVPQFGPRESGPAPAPARGADGPPVRSLWGARGSAPYECCDGVARRAPRSSQAPRGLLGAGPWSGCAPDAPPSSTTALLFPHSAAALG